MGKIRENPTESLCGTPETKSQHTNKPPPSPLFTCENETQSQVTPIRTVSLNMHSPTPPHPASQPSIPRLPPSRLPGLAVDLSSFLPSSALPGHTDTLEFHLQICRLTVLAPTPSQTGAHGTRHTETHRVPRSHAQTRRLTSTPPVASPKTRCFSHLRTCSQSHPLRHRARAGVQPQGFAHCRLSTPNLPLSLCVCVHAHIVISMYVVHVYM